MNPQPYIERIRKSLFNNSKAVITHPDDFDIVLDELGVSRATNAILTVMADMLEEMCGEDEDIHTRPSGVGRFINEVDRVAGRNTLRADLREQIATLRKEIQK